MYEHDLWTIDAAEKFDNEVEALASDSSADPEMLLSQIEQRFATIEAKLAERRKILAEL